jgi:hypothetical protein
MEMFRRSLPNDGKRNHLRRLSIRLIKILAETRTSNHLNENGKRLAGYGDYALNENPLANAGISLTVSLSIVYFLLAI